jgi:hypothetical protein
MWILKKYDYYWKKNFAFWQKLGDFIETKAKKSPTSPDLVSPDLIQTKQKTNTRTYVNQRDDMLTKKKELNNYWIYQSFRKLKTLAWHSIRQAKKFPRPKNMTKIQDSFRFALCNIHVLLHNMQLFTIFKTFFFWQRKSHSHWIYCITQEIYGLVWLKDWFLILQLLINLTLFLTFTGLVSECRLNITTILGVCAPLITGGSYRTKHTS